MSRSGLVPAVLRHCQSCIQLQEGTLHERSNETGCTLRQPTLRTSMHPACNIYALMRRESAPPTRRASFETERRSTMRIRMMKFACLMLSRTPCRAAAGDTEASCGHVTAMIRERCPRCWPNDTVCFMLVSHSCVAVLRPTQR